MEEQKIVIDESMNKEEVKIDTSRKFQLPFDPQHMYSDLELKFQELQHKKDSVYKEFKTKEERLLKAVANAQKENITLKEEIEQKNSIVNEKDTEILLLKTLVDSKSTELTKIRVELDSKNDLLSKLLSENEKWKLDYETLTFQNDSLKNEIDKVKELYDKMIDGKGEDLEKLKQLEYELSTSRKQLNEQIVINEGQSEEKKLIEIELNEEKITRIDHQKEVERLILSINGLKSEQDELIIKIRDLEILLQKSDERNTEINIILEAREKDLNDTKKFLTELEIRNQEDHDEIDSLQSEKLKIQALLESTRKELEKATNAKNEYYFNLNKINEEKNKIESKFYSALSELKQTKDNLFALNEQYSKRSEEFSNLLLESQAVKEHLSVLEKQNLSVCLI